MTDDPNAARPPLPAPPPQNIPGDPSRSELPPSVEAKYARRRARAAAEAGGDGHKAATRRRARTRKRPHRPRPTVLAQQRAFLRQFALIGNVTSAAQLVRIDRMRHYEWLADTEKYPEYRARFQQAEVEFCDAIERAVAQRGIYGFDRPVYQGGKLVGHERVFSDALLQMAAKAHLPHKYRERLDISGPGGGPIQTEDLSALPLAALQERLSRAVGVIASSPPPPGPPIDVKAIEAGPVGMPIPEPEPESREARLAAYEREVAARKGNGHAPGNGHGGNGHG